MTQHLERDTVEQPRYSLLEAPGQIEIRQYGTRLTAETDLGPGTGMVPGQESAFMTLAAYIFAWDRTGEAVAMTAPVAMGPGEQGTIMRFFMPAELTEETLPRPSNDRVRIVTVPPQLLAVLRFSGEATSEIIALKQDDLLRHLLDGEWRPVSRPGFFAYDPPMTPPELRRNEVFVEVTPTPMARALLAAAESPRAREGFGSPASGT